MVWDYGLVCMSLVLNGTSQYVSLGDAVDIRSATPILIVAVVDTTGLPSGTRGLYSQGDYSANTGHGAFAYGGPPKSQGNYAAPQSGATVEQDLTANIPADDGWYLIAWTIYNTGVAPNINLIAKVQTYSYTHGTWSVQDTQTIAASLSSSALQVPAGGQTTVIAANLITTIHNFWSGKYSWIAVFNNNGGGAGTQIKDTAIAAELIANGFWNLLDGNCKLAIAFNGNTTDQSGNGHNGTLIGAPTYGAAGPGEVNGSTGDLSVTQAAETISAAGSVLVSGDTSIAQSDQTISSDGSIVTGDVIGNLDLTQDIQTLLSAGGVLIVGDLSKTQASNTVFSSDVSPVIGAATATVHQIAATATVAVSARPIATISVP